MEVRLERDLVAFARAPPRPSGRLHEIADPANVQDDAVAGLAGEATPQPRDHPATARRSGGAIAWQIATASASDAWSGVGRDSILRIDCTIRCTCAFSARP